MSSAIEKLEIGNWKLPMSPEAKAVYGELRQYEDGFLAACAAGGMGVYRRSDETRFGTARKRQAVVIVPPSKSPPVIDLGRYQAWADIIRDLIDENHANGGGIMDTVGARSIIPPRWVWPDGSLSDARPSIEASSMTRRIESASRGASISPEEAIRYVVGRIESMTAARDNSVKRYEHRRAETQDAKIGEYLDAADIIREKIGFAARLNKRLGVQISSGEAWKIRLGYSDLPSVSITVPNIGLIAISPDFVHVTPRTRAARHQDAEVIQAGPIRLTIY
jgi:hypothetical protein